MNCLYFLALVLLGFQNVFCLDDTYFNQYEGYKVYLVSPVNEQQLQMLSLLQNDKRYTFWTEVQSLSRPINIMTKKDYILNLEKNLKNLNIPFKVVIENVADAIRSQHDFSKPNNLEDFDYGKYHTLDEINAWVDQIAQTYAGYVSVFNVTNSFEKRYIKAFKISIPSSTKKPALWFDGGIHAREWISPATVIYIAYSLLSQYGKNDDVTKILDTFDFYILPVFNVDGYVYTWTTNRMWRKTRSRHAIPLCVGVDPNRNWDDHWCEGGASRDPCSDSYCGPKPFSEVEVKGVADFLAQHNDTILCYINFHSYSQLWMSPYGWTTNLPSNYTLQDGGSAAAVTALEKLFQTQYQHGNIASTIYVASGNSADWTYSEANIFFSYAVELRDQGQYGFLLPEDQIIPSGQETFEAIKALAFYISSNI